MKNEDADKAWLQEVEEGLQDIPLRRWRRGGICEAVGEANDGVVDVYKIVGA